MNKKGKCHITKYKNGFLVRVIGCSFSRKVENKEKAEQIRSDYVKYGLKYIKDNYPKNNNLTYEEVVNRFKEKFPDNMVGINKIIKIYKIPKIYTLKNSAGKIINNQKMYHIKLKCTKCGREKKTDIRNVLYEHSQRLNKTGTSCICQMEVCKDEYIGKIFGDFKILNVEEVRKNWVSKKNSKIRLAHCKCIHCGNEETFWFYGLIKNNCLCDKCHHEIRMNKRTIKVLNQTSSSNDDNGSNIKGVWFDKYKQKWCARISEKVVDDRGKVKTRHFFLGEFNNYDDAVAARMYAVEHRILELEKENK